MSLTPLPTYTCTEKQEISSKKIYDGVKENMLPEIKRKRRTVNLVNEYDQEIPQSQTEDKRMATERKGKTTTTIAHEDKLTEATIMMIAKSEWTQSDAQQNTE